MSADTLTAADRYGEARSLLMSGLPEAALDAIADARQMFLRDGDMLGALRTDLGRINVLDDLGRHGESVRTAEGLVRELARLEPAADADTHLWLSAAANENLGAVLGRQGCHEAASAALRRAETAYQAIGAPEDRARVLANLGIEAFETGDLDAAREALTNAIPSLADDPFLESRGRQHLALVEARAGRFGRATDLTSNLPLDGDETDDLRRRLVAARISAELNLWNDLADEAATLHTEFLGRGLLRDAAESAGLLAVAITALGDAETGHLHGLDAVGQLRDLDLDIRAAALVVELAASIDSFDSAMVADAFDTLAGAGERLAANGAALLLAERGLGEWLDRVVAPLPATQTWRHDYLHALEIGGVERRRRLRRSVETLRQLRSTVTHDDRRHPFMTNRRSPLETLLRDMVDAGDHDAALELSCEERSSSLTSTALAETAAPPIGTVVFQTIDNDLIAILNAASGAKAIRLAASPDRVRVLRERLDAQWRRLADPRMRVHLHALRAATDTVLRDLYEALMLPIELAHADGPLTIVPSASTSGIPFHALHDGTGYLIERRSIRLAAGVRASTPKPGPTLVVGVADHRAPRIEDEARQVHELTGGTLLLGNEATCSAVRDAIADHAVIHIAVHGTFDPAQPERSAIELADGTMSAADLAELDVSDKIVVLSGCSTGRQGSSGEDELVGIPRGLLLGGAATVIANLWPVDDESSVGLMNHFHLANAGTDPAAALRSAQLAALDLHPHPALWAPTVAYGWLSSSERTRS